MIIHLTDNKKRPSNYSVIDNHIKESSGDKVLLKLLKQIVQQKFEHGLDAMKILINDLLNKPEFDLSKDLINQIPKSERFLRPLLDIVSENNAPKKQIKVLEMNLSNAIMAEEVDNHLALSAIYPIEVDYTLAIKSVDTLSDEYKKKSFKLCEWNPKKSLFPSELMAIDLIIFRDDFQLWDLKVEDQLQDIHDSLNKNGFLLSFFRYKYTEPEIALNELIDTKHNLKDKLLEQRITKFLKEAKEVGLDIISEKSDGIGWKAILMRKTESSRLSKPIQSLEISNEYEKWFPILKQKIIQLKEICEESDETKLWIVANDSSVNGIIGLTNSLRLEPGGDRIRCIFDLDKSLKVPLNCKENRIFSDILNNDLVINVIKRRKSRNLQTLEFG